MINRKALIVVLATAASVYNANAFAPSSHPRCRETRLYESSSPADATTEKISEAIVESTVENEKLIMDIPPPPAADAKPKPVAKNVPKKKGNPHKEGVFSPIVVAAGAVLGDEQLNKVRAKAISMHSDIIKSFVDTSDSAFGKAVLRQIFEIVDADGSGYLDKEELGKALNLLGFKWLKEKHVEKIFERADANGDKEISLEEFVEEAPKTLRTNLIKLAKTNGGDMGLLV